MNETENRIDRTNGSTWEETSQGQEMNTWTAAAQTEPWTAGPVPGNQPPMQASALKKQDTEYTKRMKNSFSFFGPVTFVYALFYAFCMFHNGSGITFPFFVAGSLLYLCFSLSKLEISLKKGSVFYMIGMMLLGVSTFCTDDWRIIAFNKTGIFLLMMSLLLKQFFDTTGWKLGKYLWAVCELVFASIGELGRPFSDAAAYLKHRENKRNGKIWYAALGGIITIPLFVIVMALLSSADAVFRDMTKRLLENIRFDNIFNIIFRVVFLYFASYLLMSYLCRRLIKEEVKDRKKGEPVLAITVTGMLSLLYLLFSGIQILYLFLGKMKLPEGYTYASYAREGFFQLLAVSVLNLIIVLAVMSFFRDSKILKVILTIMSLCTFIMIASSALRMIIYIQYYYMTFLRILVLWALAVLFLLFAGVVMGIFNQRFPLFQYSAAVVTVLYLGLSFSHPDYIIAAVNVANAPREGENRERNEDDFFKNNELYHDYAYLSNLSADAAPVLIPYLKELGYDINVFYEDNIWKNETVAGASSRRASGFGYYYLSHLKDSTENFSWRTFNLSRYMALKQVEKCKSSENRTGYLQELIFINETEYPVSEIRYTCRMDGWYLGGSQCTMETESMPGPGESFSVSVENEGIMEIEYPQVSFEIEITFDGAGKFDIEEPVKADENGELAPVYAIRGNAETGFMLEGRKHL